MNTNETPKSGLLHLAVAVVAEAYDIAYRLTTKQTFAEEIPDKPFNFERATVIGKIQNSRLERKYFFYTYLPQGPVPANFTAWQEYINLLAAAEYKRSLKISTDAPKVQTFLYDLCLMQVKTVANFKNRRA